MVLLVPPCWVVLSPLEKMGPPLVVTQFSVVVPLWYPDVVVGKWLVENFRLVVIMPAVEHCLCAHMVLLVPGCGGHVSVL